MSRDLAPLAPFHSGSARLARCDLATCDSGPSLRLKDSVDGRSKRSALSRSVFASIGQGNPHQLSPLSSPLFLSLACHSPHSRPLLRSLGSRNSPRKQTQPRPLPQRIRSQHLHQPRDLIPRPIGARGEHPELGVDVCRVHRWVSGWQVSTSRGEEGNVVNSEARLSGGCKSRGAAYNNSYNTTTNHLPLPSQPPTSTMSAITVPIYDKSDSKTADA